MKNKDAMVDAALLVIRVVLGVIFIYHGYQKVFGPGGMEKFIGGLTNMGVPQPKLMAWVAAIWELGGGILVALGLFTRIAALGLAGIMVVAIFKVHLPNGFSAQNSGYEYQLALWAMAMALTLAGGGKFALDSVMFKKKKPGGP